MMRKTATTRLRSRTRSGEMGGSERASPDGKTTPMAAKKRIDDRTETAFELKRWVLNLNPPARKQVPNTRRELDRTDPRSEAWMTRSKPRDIAMMEMMSSGALPKVALTSPPIVGPVQKASSSVQFPSRLASGMTATKLNKKTSRGFHSQILGKKGRDRRMRWREGRVRENANSIPLERKGEGMRASPPSPVIVPGEDSKWDKNKQNVDVISQKHMSIYKKKKQARGRFEGELRGRRRLREASTASLSYEPSTAMPYL